MRTITTLLAVFVGIAVYKLATALFFTPTPTSPYCQEVNIEWQENHAYVPIDSIDESALTALNARHVRCVNDPTSKEL
jgi:hypothetical protein